MDTTAKHLIQMLKENTGAAMLDSGGAYGRNWERNQKRDFSKEPVTILGKVWEGTKDGSKFEPEVTHNTFPWLHERLTFSPEMNRKYQAFAKSRRQDAGELEIMEEFTVEGLRGEVAGLYGEGNPFTVNTYNGECLLDQTLQFRLFSVGGITYILLQIHGGCDVRGGYTDAKCFAVDDDDAAMYGFADAVITSKPRYVKDSPTYWQTDDGYHWYAEGTSGKGAGKELQDYPISRDVDHKGDGEHVFVDAGGNAHSPLTGLILYAY